MLRKAVLINQTQAPAVWPPRLAGLPLLLRAILSAQRAGIEEILIVGGDHPGRLLERDRRVQLRWRSVPSHGSDSGSEVIKALLGVAGELKENFVLLFADSIFEPQALASLRQAPLEGQVLRAAVLPETTDRLSEASLYLCSPEFLHLLKEAAASKQNFHRIESWAAQLRERGRANTVEVAGRVWPRTTERNRLRRVQRELSRVHLKPSDGFYARFNKMWLAQPLIRLFVRTPATPNLITSLGLLLGVGAGLAFAQGGYWWAVGGAVMAFLSGIMDHVDGMVARLKFQESDFGTWFESIADSTSTFSVFIGMAIGLYRETGFAHHLVVGGLFVFGAVMSFITMSRQRKRISGDNPADYPNRAHRVLEQNSRNFFYWFARKTYFVARRAALPYYILFFCLLDLRVLLLGWTTLGANVLWILTLYSNRLFRPVAAPKVTAEAD